MFFRNIDKHVPDYTTSHQKIILFVAIALRTSCYEGIVRKQLLVVLLRARDRVEANRFPCSHGMKREKLNKETRLHVIAAHRELYKNSPARKHLSYVQE
jgi:hypothetical protein